jgi:hypothetical protein
MIKLKDLLFEQKTEIFKVAPFKQAFLPNYVTPADTWKTEFGPVLQEIKARIKAKWTLDQLQITIVSGASEKPATNGYTGTNPPNHNFQKVGQTTGGLLPGGKWTNIYDKRVNVREPEGNDFLAKTRGDQLKNALIPYLKSQLGQDIPAEFIIIQPKRNSEKFVKASLTAKVSTTPSPTKLPPKGTYVLGQGYEGLGIDSTKIWPNLPTNPQYDKWRANPASAKEKLQRYGVRLLAKDTKADLGAGAGRHIVVTKALAKLLADRGDSPFASRGWVNRYGGDWIDYEIDQWIKYMKNYNGKLPGNFKPKYIDIKTGKPIPGLHSALNYKLGPLSSPPTGIDYNTLF